MTGNILDGPGKTNKNKNGGRGWVGRQSEGLGGVVWVETIELK